MSRGNDAAKALTNTDWSGAEVERVQRPASTVYSVRLPDALAQKFETLATARGVTPTGLLRELAESAIVAGTGEEREVTVRPSDLHRVLDRWLVEQGWDRQAA